MLTLFFIYAITCTYPAGYCLEKGLKMKKTNIGKKVWIRLKDRFQHCGVVLRDDGSRFYIFYNGRFFWRQHSEVEFD